MPVLEGLALIRLYCLLMRRLAQTCDEVNRLMDCLLTSEEASSGSKKSSWLVADSQWKPDLSNHGLRDGIGWDTGRLQELIK